MLSRIFLSHFLLSLSLSHTQLALDLQYSTAYCRVVPWGGYPGINLSSSPLFMSPSSVARMHRALGSPPLVSPGPTEANFMVTVVWKTMASAYHQTGVRCLKSGLGCTQRRLPLCFFVFSQIMEMAVELHF